MNKRLYAKLAFDGIRKNRQMYFPYIMTCVAMVTMYYIMSFLQISNALDNSFGSGTIRMILGLGTWVIAIFSLIFLFYTNSFLIRRRKKEFGLYNILGMGKRNIAVILFFETLIVYIFSVVTGLIFGIAFSKIAELALIHAIKGEINYKITVSLHAIYMSVILFGCIFILLFINSIRQVRHSSAIALLNSENVGEKPPKGNMLLGILGLIFIVSGYCISVGIENPIMALMAFFAAVLLVIVGTYLLMIAGSVMFCRLLQKNKGYYYKPEHFVSVSSMVYRMKRNGAGLASICILATMVLVMISSTTTLYTNSEDSLHLHYPREINIRMQYDSLDKNDLDDIKSVQSEIEAVCRENDVIPTNVVRYSAANVTGQIQGTQVETDRTLVNEWTTISFDDIVMFYFISADDYNTLGGSDIKLNDDETLMISNKFNYKGDMISFKGGREFTIIGKGEKPKALTSGMEYLVPVIYLVVPDVDSAVKGLDTLNDISGIKRLSFESYYYFDTEKDSEAQVMLHSALSAAAASEESYSKHTFSSIGIDDRESNREDFYSTFGGLFYLGIVLSFVFLVATVLIIYYKQISEGYEDEKRFDIMQKVGITKREIRRSINSQLLTVFFLPLVLAGLHLAFAMPIVSKMLIMFGMANTKIFVITAAASFCVFAMFYAVVYKITSNAYYRIVSGV
ncbi:MAG: ABC transporter permease [Clostridia bacterium]|nr:ABC transporter permease [Clostridia bacterium]